ncbi:MAG: redoxin domain-containing protein, partial [Gammaproteobacteria bacterium]|nr:redoxin domain-containing protein [Gammaproteobacteria bacterium]
MNKYQNGDQLPAFRLKLGEADILDLPAGLTSDYTIILFYRGHWCPFCRRLLDKYEQRIDQ